jgi:hypothetical protein
MDQIASFIVFMLAAMAIALSVLVAAVFCIGLCEGASWMFSRARAAAAVRATAVIRAERSSVSESFADRSYVDQSYVDQASLLSR